ncbi:MAG: hypothetical protein EHM12_08035 [Dehalococcoidia bacterium]|nr:MAG: hypothetical protein EHM12_08035 [Dehalococcoidia bacterium]
MENTAKLLSKDEEKVYNFLSDLHSTMSTNEIKSIDPFIKKHELPSQISPVIFIDGIITKNRPYKWNGKKPDEEMATEVFQDTSTYISFKSKTDQIKNLFKDENEFKFDLKKIWKELGYCTYYKAKDTLIGNCEKDKDYIISLQGTNMTYLSHNGDEKEIFMLSEIGLKMFLSFSQKPMAKWILRTICQIEQEAKTFLRMVFKGANNLVLEGKVLDDVEEAGQLNKILKVKLAEKLHDKIVSGSFILNFEEFLLESIINQHLEEYTKIIKQSFINKNNVVLQLPESSKALSIAEKSC